MAQPVQKLLFAFSFNLKKPFPIDYMVKKKKKDTYYRLKERIRETQGLQKQDISRWQRRCVYPKWDWLLASSKISSISWSCDPGVDIVIYGKPERKDISSGFTPTGKYHLAPFILVRTDIYRITLSNTGIRHSSEFGWNTIWISTVPRAQTAFAWWGGATL